MGLKSAQWAIRYFGGLIWILGIYFRCSLQKYKIKLSFRGKIDITKQRIRTKRKELIKRFCTTTDEQEAQAMANEEDDLDLLLSLQDKVDETPPGTPPHSSGSMLNLSTMVITN